MNFPPTGSRENRVSWPPQDPYHKGWYHKGEGNGPHIPQDLCTGISADLTLPEPATLWWGFLYWWPTQSTQSMNEEIVFEPISIPASPMNSALSGIRKPGNACDLARLAEGNPPPYSCKGRLLQVLAGKLGWPVTVPGKPGGQRQNSHSRAYYPGFSLSQAWALHY